MIRIPPWTVAFSCVLMVAFMGCRSFTPPVTYYTLRSISGQLTGTDADGKVPITIGIRPVELPGYINRTQMVTRTGSHQLVISSLNRWADYPDRLVQQIIADNLQVLMPHARVINAPWPVDLKPAIIVSFQFQELIGTADKQMLLSAVWTIAGVAPPITEQSRRVVIEESVPGSGFDDLAAAHSQVLEALCREVARELDGLLVRANSGAWVSIRSATDWF